jgi:uncharacterized protein
MSSNFGALAFTSAVQALQERYGSRRQYERQASSGAPQDRLSAQESDFIADRDSFYLATVGSTGWPYIQHRGGPKGFLKVIDDQTLAFADFRGNKQYISTGNLATDERVALIMVDYPRRARLKLLGHAKTLAGAEADEWLERVRSPKYKAVIERVFVIHVDAFDWNCPQHITERYTADEIREVLTPVTDRLEQLERENLELRQRLDAR